MRLLRQPEDARAHFSLVQDAVKSVERGPLLRRPGDLDADHVAMVHVQAVQRFGYLLSTLQQDLDKLQDAPGAAARISQLLFMLVARERRAHPSASAGDRAEKLFRALEALLVSYGASAMGAATHGPAAGMVSVCPSSVGCLILLVPRLVYGAPLRGGHYGGG